MRENAGVSRWLRDGLAQAHFGATVIGSLTALIAPSSRTATANSQPIHVAELVANCRELFEPPEQPARPILRLPVDAT
jgi:hypothetical protein